MVDVGEKKITKRSASAQSIVELPDLVINQFKAGEISTPKGPVFSTAIIAATFGAKKTSELIPFCHQLPLEKCKVELRVEGNCVIINCTVSTHHKTGVEMEALTGASIAALTVYDMCKSISHEIVIKETRLIMKTGGKSDIQNKN